VAIQLQLQITKFYQGAETSDMLFEKVLYSWSENPNHSSEESVETYIILDSKRVNEEADQ
jgi:hypothetical protein